MPSVDTNLNLQQLLCLLADHHHARAPLSDEDKQLAVVLLKKRAEEELDFGEELVHDSIRLIRRVTGAVGVFFNS
ncbi:MAG: hypothetical protein SGJ27_18595 [Candidatus Melainabacteria bacterium]|nr:hypothetical protein [Candidatus Melainabacteria bacterium]